MAIGVAIWFATRRPVPDQREATRAVRSRDADPWECGSVKLGDPDYWDYQCYDPETTGALLVRFDGNRIVDSDIIA